VRKPHDQRTRRRRSDTAVLIVDLVSEFEFRHWRALLAAARRIVPRIVRLKARARAAGVPVIYVNDASGTWESDQSAFVRRCTADDARGRDVARQIRPDADDYFIFKPKHSAFYATPLAELLERLQATRLVLTGLSSHQCVLFTAVDAYVRDFQLIVPPDCIGAPAAIQTRHALFVLKDAVQAQTPRSSRIRFG
jgi:nicotinamidase-related amidase